MRAARHAGRLGGGRARRRHAVLARAHVPPDRPVPAAEPGPRRGQRRARRLRHHAGGRHPAGAHLRAAGRRTYRWCTIRSQHDRLIPHMRRAAELGYFVANGRRQRMGGPDGESPCGDTVAGRRLVSPGSWPGSHSWRPAAPTRSSGSPRGVDIGPLTTAEGDRAGADELRRGRRRALHRARWSPRTAAELHRRRHRHADRRGVRHGHHRRARRATILYVDKTLYLKAATKFWGAHGRPLRRHLRRRQRARATAGSSCRPSLLGMEFGEIFTPDVVAQTAGKAGDKAADAGARARRQGEHRRRRRLRDPGRGRHRLLREGAPHGVLRFDARRASAARRTPRRRTSCSTSRTSRRTSSRSTSRSPRRRAGSAPRSTR